MKRLQAHFDGQAVVLDEAPPPELTPNMPVEVVIPEGRDRALREFNEYMEALWSDATSAPGQSAGRRWKREDLYGRGGHGLP